MGKVVEGDRVVVHSTQLGVPAREGVVVEARGPGGTAPFVVRWSDTGVETLVFPGPGTTIQHAPVGADQPAGSGG